jgi:hypothetical protein
MDAAWIETLLRACEVLNETPDLDSTAHLSVTPFRGGLIVEVRLEDGRATLRRVTDPTTLTTTLRALLTLPPKAPEPPEPPDTLPSVPTPKPPSASGRAGTTDLEAVPEPSPRPSESVPGMEIGAMLSGNLSAAPTYLGVGPQVLGMLHSGPWIFGVTTRWYALQRRWEANLQQFEMQTFAVSLDFGRRSQLGPLALDLGAGPWLLAESQSAEQSGEEKGGTETDVRFGGFVRALVGSAPLRWSFQLESSASPWRVNRSLQMDDALPALPSWGIGLGIGAIWSEP